MGFGNVRKNIAKKNQICDNKIEILYNLIFDSFEKVKSL